MSNKKKVGDTKIMVTMHKQKMVSILMYQCNT